MIIREFNNETIESCCIQIFDSTTTKKQRQEAVKILDAEICRINGIKQISNTQMHKLRYKIYSMYLSRNDIRRSI